MLQKDFKKFFLENILSFLWRQWSTLGIAGSARAEDIWVIDPEALLMFSLEITRYEPRLFDEILDWLVVNGKWLDIQRLRGIMKTKEGKTQRLTSAVGYFLSHEAKTYQRKWRMLGLLNKTNSCRFFNSVTLLGIFVNFRIERHRAVTFCSSKL